MKMPEFISFHFDKFTMNLFKRHGAAGVGRWLLIRKAVAETETLTINLNDITERETLELDTQCTPQELTDLLDHAAQRGMIDPTLYSTGILWVEKLDQDLTSFFKSGKRKIPEKPTISRNFSERLGHLQEKFLEMGGSGGKNSETSSHMQARAFDETKRNETKRDEYPPTPLENSGGEEERKEDPIPVPKVEVKFVEHPNRKPESELDAETEVYVALMKKINAAMPRFFDAYGKLGSPEKIQQGMMDAIRELKEIAPSVSDADCIEKIISQATLARKAYHKAQTEEQFVKSPEKWLSEGCYKLPYAKKKSKDEAENYSPMQNPYIWSK